MEPLIFDQSAVFIVLLLGALSFNLDGLKIGFGLAV